MTGARAYHAIVALLALIGLILEYHATITGHPGEIARRTLIYASFFTVLGNAIVMAMAAGAALDTAWAGNPAVRAATTLYIVVVAVVFQLLLAAIVRPTGIDWWGNMLAHRLVPALWVLGWITLGRHGGIRVTSPLLWLIYPAVYGAWTLLHGAISGWYPYPFLSVAKEGGERVAINMAWMALFFVVLGYAIRWIDGRLASRRSP